MVKVSIIVPCYNQAQYLDECLQSVMDQTYDNWECIIVNDGSPDHTEEIGQMWVEQDARFKYLYKENGGLSSARNAGIEVANGEWIQFLDCDDKLHKEKLSHSSKYFSDYECVITDFVMFDENGNKGKYCDYSSIQISYENLLFGWDLDFTIPIHAGLFKKCYITKFNENLKAKEDWIFWLDFFKNESLRNIFVADSMALYRNTPNSMTKKLSFMHAEEVKAFDYICSKYCHDSLEVKKFLESRIRIKNMKLEGLNDAYENLSKDYHRFESSLFCRAIVKLKKILK